MKQHTFSSLFLLIVGFLFLSFSSSVAANTPTISIAQLDKLAKQGDVESQFVLANEYYLGENIEKDLKLAHYWYKQVALAGYASAQFNIANNYYNGVGTKQDIDKAIIWYERAARQNVGAAAYNLGVIYFDRNQNKQGMFWYERAAELNYTLAELYLARIYTDGVLAKQNLITAESWYQRASKNDNAVAEYEYAGFLESQGRMAEAIKFYEKSAQSNYFKAQYQLAYLHRIAKGVKVDNKKAYSLLKEAVKKEYAPAQYLLGVVYKTYKKDLKTALKWYKKAADNGNVFAQYSLAIAYLKGDGIEKDTTAATKYFIKAADAGYSNAQYSLAVRYLTGVGIAKNYTEAIKWLERAAAQNHPFADYSLALRYKLGQGVPRDISKQIYHLEKSYALNNAEAKYELAVLTLNNYQTSLTKAKATTILEKLAPTHKTAAYELGKALAPTNEVKAKKYLTIAVEKNNTNAKRLLAALNSSDKSALTEMLDADKVVVPTKTIVRNTPSTPNKNTSPTIRANTPLSEELKLLEIAAKDSDVTAQYKLAQAYLNGNGVSKDSKKGISLLTQAASEEYPPAQYDLGIVYKEGVHTKINYQLAYYWTIKALQNNHVSANETLQALQSLIE